MKGKSHPTNDVTLNPSTAPSIRDVIDQVEPSRRRFLMTSMSSATLAAIGGVSTLGLVDAVSAAPLPPAGGFGGIGFDSITPTMGPVPDLVRVPPGYKAELLVAWGDPITPLGPIWAEDASQDAAAQAQQFGAHTDGMHYFGFPVRGTGGVSSERGILCVNNEYTHEEILHIGGLNTAGSPSTIAKIRKSQAAHGVSVMEVRKTDGKWGVHKSSAFGRRLTANTPMRISGAAAGHPLMQSKVYDIQPTGSVDTGTTSNGRTGFGTVNNCAHGTTPWGTYLTCEENWNGYFGTTAGGFSATKLENRYGVNSNGFGYRWHIHDPRFDIRANPNEANHFGWVVEIDPFDPTAMPVKRTGLGRLKHESAQYAVSEGNRVAFYTGDDERNEYIYKFVCTRPMNPRNRADNRDLLDDGILYVAKFSSTPGAAANTFRGEWMALTPSTIGLNGQPLSSNPEFAAATPAESQALILIKTRMAADAVGATMMDRPEWIALRSYMQADVGRVSASSYDAQRPLELYCTLTNNSRRGNTPASSNLADGSTVAATANPPVDLANPRPDNDYGHIIRWREDGNVVTATGFEWDIFLLAGDENTTKTLPGSYNTSNLTPAAVGSTVGYKGNINDLPNGSADFGAPDGLWFDYFGRLWIQTDQVGNATGDWVNIGSNTMLCADPSTKEVRRFLTSPNKCEVTGVVTTPDGRAMFVGIQHPGEDSTSVNPTEFSNWPQGQWDKNSAGQALPNTAGMRRPRSSIVLVTRADGGVVGGL